MRPELDSEWLETDGLGGYASGTVGLVRTRRYHALLVSAATPPTGRFVLVNSVEARVTTPAGVFPISAEAYAPGIVEPDGRLHLKRFDAEPWPRWRFVLPDGTAIDQAIAMVHDRPVVCVTWRLAAARGGVTLAVRPLLSGREHHALHRENPAFRFEEESHDGRLVWRPYPGVPSIAVAANGAFRRAPLWYRNFLYAEERARGFDHLEDLASPGEFVFELSRGEACLVLEAGVPSPADAAGAGAGRRPTPGAAALSRALRARERRRRAHFPSRLHRAADAYIVRRGGGRTIVAGYPWFTDWGRDTFIALRGLCLATGRLDAARAILIEWAGTLSDGRLPNTFPERGGRTADFGGADVSLWFAVAAHDWLGAMQALGRRPSKADVTTLRRTIEAILTAALEGARDDWRVADDGLLAAGRPGSQATWMDARVGGRPVTPRFGKPVEIEALWINALGIAAAWTERFREPHRRALAAFHERFWHAAGGYLFDVVDVEGRAGESDAALRPNQILAVGGLPFPVLEGPRARAVVDTVEARLLTPLGLRTLDPADPAYRPRYVGDVAARDGAYHQGTAWPWLLGPFVEAWVRVRGGGAASRREARRRFLEPLVHHLETAGLEHVSEIADGDPPHAPRGCPFQAWSVGEVIRLSRGVLASTRRGAD